MRAKELLRNFALEACGRLSDEPVRLDGADQRDGRQQAVVATVVVFDTDGDATVSTDAVVDDECEVAGVIGAAVNFP